MIQGCMIEADDNFVRAGLRIGKLPQLEHLRPAEP